MTMRISNSEHDSSPYPGMMNSWGQDVKIYDQYTIPWIDYDRWIVNELQQEIEWNWGRDHEYQQ